MSDTTPQNFKNHGRLDPPFHMVLFTVLIVNLVIAICFTVQHFSLFSAWLVILSIRHITWFWQPFWALTSSSSSLIS